MAGKGYIYESHMIVSYHQSGLHEPTTKVVGISQASFCKSPHSFNILSAISTLRLHFINTSMNTPIPDKLCTKLSLLSAVNSNCCFFCLFRFTCPLIATTQLLFDQNTASTCVTFLSIDTCLPHSNDLDVF